MSIGAPEVIDVLPLAPGATIVEQEDVVFALGLCREIHRIYGDYLEGSVKSDESLEAGLMMTIEMLAIMSQSVDSGMPAMRVGVAAAQVTEMLAVLFDRNGFGTPLGPQLRSRYRAMLAEPRLVPQPELPAPAGDEPVRGRRGLSRLLRRRRK
jgi:hypothetical protein